MYVSVTNYRTGQVEYLSEGDLVESVIASSSIPVLFTPARINGQLYIDGGVVDNFPIQPIRDCCTTLVGVAVNPIGEEQGRASIVSISVRSFHLSMASELKFKKKQVDIFIEPEGLKDFSLIDVKSGPRMYDIGYAAAKEVLGGQTANNQQPIINGQ